MHSLDYEYFDENNLAYVLEPGDASFKITQVVSGVSKSNNKMMIVTFNVTDRNGKRAMIDDYLVATVGDVEGMKRLASKVKAIACAINRPDLYGPGKKLTDQNLLGMVGRCVVKTKVSAGYPDKSVIAKYYDDTTQQHSQDKEFDDTLPF